MSGKRRFDPLLAFIAALPGLAGLATLIPWPTASKSCLLGYSALCSFTPLSTGICLLGSYYLWRFLSGSPSGPAAKVEEDAANRSQ